MAADENACSPEASATLVSEDGRYVLRFVLVPLENVHDTEWHGYELHLKDALGNRSWSLVATDDEPLFLDRTYEPEVPMLCAGLRRAAQSGGSFSFSPVDERDFTLDVAPDVAGLRVRVQFDSQPAPSELGWPEGVACSREAVRRFADDLESAYQGLTRWTRSSERA